MAEAPPGIPNTLFMFPELQGINYSFLTESFNLLSI